LFILVALAVLISIPGFAQRGDERGGQRDHNTLRAPIGPRPSASSQARQSSCQTRTRTPRRRPRQQPPHVTNDHWYGHDRPDDKRYRVDHAFDRGRFEHFGPSYRYRIERFDRDHHRFWFPGGFYFQVADWDWARCCRLVLELRG
jgi:hypothetical protein